MVFCPTHFATGSIFRHIIGTKLKSNLMQGHFGISKTISILLYSRLSNIIINYFMKYPKHSNNKICRQKLLLTPKLVYWTLEYNKDFSYD